MFIGIQSIWIPKERSKVYEIATTYPYFVGFFKAGSKKLNESEDFLSVEVHTNLFGILPTVWFGEGKKQKNASISFTQTQGLFKDLKAVWSFSDFNDGTTVTIQTSFEKKFLGNFLEEALGKMIVEKTTRAILQELKEKAIF